MVSRDCLSAETLGAYAAGTPTPVDAETIDAHLRACDDCVARLDELAARPDPLVAALRGVTPPPQARELARAIAAVLALSEGPTREMASAPVVGTLDPLLVISQVLSSAPAAPLVAGSLLNEYRLLERLGAGGMGTVYRALHVRLDKEVALKVIQPLRGHDPQMRARFQREMKAIGKLRHPHIVLATDAGEAQGVLYLVMELEQGTDLAAYVRRQGRLPVAEACAYAHQAALGLQCAHEIGLVHRDVKPSNLFRTASGQIKLLDLGLALLEVDETPGNVTFAGSPAATANGDTPLGTGCTRGPMGTDDYMSPEQWCDAHQVDARADLYGLGCTLFYLLTGQPPFSQADHSTREQKRDAHRAALPPRLCQLRPDVSPKLDALVQRLLAKDPQDRPKSAADVAHDLARVAGRSPRRVIASVLTAAAVVALAIVLPRLRNEPEAGPAANSMPSVAPGKAMDQPATPSPKPAAASKTDPPPSGILPMTATEAKDLQQQWADYLEQPDVATNSIGMNMVLVPPGEFLTGASTLIHSNAYEISATEVTRGQFRAFVLDANYQTDAEASGQGGILYHHQPLLVASRNPGFIWREPGYAVTTDNQPVVHVTWHDAIAFCQWLSRRENKTYRLPTLAQWQWAARAGADTVFYHGDDIERLSDYAWHLGNSGQQPHPVAKKLPNAWGLYDTLGNVAEWSRDGPGPWPIGPTRNPEIPVPERSRLVVGGSHLVDPAIDGGRAISLKAGGAMSPQEPNSMVGFRVVCEQYNPLQILSR